MINFFKKLFCRNIAVNNVTIMNGYSSGGDLKVGSGIQGKKNIDIEEFYEKLIIEGSLSVDFKYSKKNHIVITSDDNLLDCIDYSVKDGVLCLYYKSGISFQTSNSISIEVFSPYLSKVVLSGSGDINICNIAQKKFSAQVLASGSVKLKGKVEFLTLEVNGSGDISAYSLKSNELNTFIKGSGEIKAYACVKSDVFLKGSGSIFIKGNPKIKNLNKMGSGEIRFT